MVYHAVSPWLNRRLFTYETRSTLHLRRAVREYLGLRRSVRYRYRQIGTNSFNVETQRGWPIMQLYGVT